MSTFRNRAFGALLIPVFAGLLAAQSVGTDTAPATPSDTTSANDSSALKAPVPLATVPQGAVQNIRPRNASGINVFETPKNDGPFEGVQLRFGGAFVQQFQGIKHENKANARIAGGVNQNQLAELGYGFNTAVANLSMQVQLADGIRVDLLTYLSSRRHSDTWVKGGYLQVDKLSFLKSPTLDAMMRYLTIRAGHFEINYGDAHLRRSDNGDALYNPFVGNLVMDAFTTEIGGDVMFKRSGFLAMAGVTGGEIKGNLKSPGDRAPSFLGKVGFDRQFSQALRARLTGSAYITRKSPAQTLYAGDRAGSQYVLVLENTAATESGSATSGLFNPGFRREVTAFMVNPFIKWNGVEFFGTIEQANGRAAGEARDRYVRQYEGQAIYRFLASEQLYVGGRYNAVNGNLAGIRDRVGIVRAAAAMGWFMTPNILVKTELVNQKYTDFPLTDIRSNGKFRGFMVEGVVAF